MLKIRFMLVLRGKLAKIAIVYFVDGTSKQTMDIPETSRNCTSRLFQKTARHISKNMSNLKLSSRIMDLKIL